jgi:choline dehydrogenase-like flavoprotein
MALQRLTDGDETVDIQETAFSVDAIARYVCNTWDEAVGNGGAPFDVIIIGAGMYGSYLATKLGATGKRVLVLEGGGYLVDQHVQNLGPTGLDVPDPMRPGDDTGRPRKAVWQLPWRGNVDFPGLASCVGGRSLYWGGWCPRQTAADLASWPATTADYLDKHYAELELETGTVPATDFLSGALNDQFLAALRVAAAQVPGIIPGEGDTELVQLAPLAVQAAAPNPGMFGFNKYSSLPALLYAIRTDINRVGADNARRTLFLVPKARVTALRVESGAVTTIEASVGGQVRRLPVTPQCAVVLAAGGIESTRLAMHSFRTPLMGRNLMVHLRSDFTLRIRRSDAPGIGAVPEDIATAAMLMRGQCPTGRFHLQVTASASGDYSEALFYKLIPDLDQLDVLRATLDPDWLSAAIRACGQTHGRPDLPVRTPGTSWIDLSDTDFDAAGVPRAIVHLEFPADDPTWDAMDAAAVRLAAGLVNTPGSIQYRYDNGWQSAPPPVGRPFPEWRDGLGTTHHESGTLWMGTDPAASVTDPVGRFHHVRNAYVCDQAAFPAVGSVNPVLTGLTMAAQLADHLA